MGEAVVGFPALYDLRHRAATYDFFVWVAHVRALGASEIVINLKDANTRKWPITETLCRAANYILPGPALLGLPCRKGFDGRDVGSSSMAELARKIDGKPFQRMQSVLPVGQEHYTVTIRHTFHNPWKNSDEDVWRAFAHEIGALVIEDYSVKPIGLHERAALYAGAKMNFGVPNGPLALLTLSDWPMIMFCDPDTTAKGFSGHGIAVGQQIPYALENQKLVWERATMDGLMREFEASALKP